MRARLALSIGMLLASASLFPATASEITGTAWFPIGPAPFTGSPEYCGGCSTDATGRASALAVNPFNPHDIYLGGANGGVWHTQDGGLSWEPISDDEPSLAIGAIALDECDPGGCNKIYAGTGENAIRRDTYPGLGLLVQDRLAGDPPFWLLRGGLVLGGGSIHNVVLDPGTSGSTKRLYVPGSPYLGGAVQFARLRITFGSRATGSTVRVFVGDAGPASTAVRAASGAIISGDITADATPVGGVPGSDQGAGAGIHYTDAVITFGPSETIRGQQPLFWKRGCCPRIDLCKKKRNVPFSARIARMADGFELRALRLREDLRARLASVREPRKAVVLGLRAALDLFGAREGAIATLNPERSGAERIHVAPQGSAWDDGLLGDYLLGARPTIPPETMLVPVVRRERNWAVLAIRDGDRAFDDEELRAFFSIAQAVTESLRQLDRLHTRDVRLRIERKIADRQDPKDLMYDILHGLRSLTRYNHSASLWIATNRDGPLELVAEQIAWTKARSKRIGQRLELPAGRAADLLRGGVHRFERSADWTPAHPDSPAWLPRALDYAASSTEPVPRETHMVGAPIVTPDGTLGVLKISSRAPGILGSYEAALVEDFMPLASLAVQFSVRTETLQARMLQAERQHALADVTRGIAHDVNNALGAMLPLVQQLRDDLQSDRLRPESLAEDLEHVEASIQVCRRIFGGMLAIARGSGRSIGHGNLRRAIDGALVVLGDGLRRRSVEVALDVPDELPLVRGGQTDLTQVVLNLCSNARDAMPAGGLLAIRARHAGEVVVAEIADTGSGIPPDVLSRVWEPFFTTKSEGNGLGLSICRSIVRDLGGGMEIASEVGRGTTVTLTLPVLEPSAREGAG